MTTRFDFGSKPPSVVRFATSDVNLNLTTLPDRSILYRAGTAIEGSSNAKVNSDGSVTLGNAVINGNDITISNLYVDNLVSKTVGNPITVNGVPLDTGGSVDYFAVTTDSNSTSYTVRSHTSVTTTDNTPTTLVNFATQFPNPGVYFCSFSVVGANTTTGTSSVGFRVNLKFHHSVGGSKAIVYDTITKTPDAAMSSTDVTLSTSALTIIGLAATNIKWACSSEITSLLF